MRSLLPEVDFRGEKRCNVTHVSVSDPESQLYRKGEGKEARLYFMGHVLMENRNGLVVDTRVTPATGTAERGAGLSMVADIPGGKRITIGADKGYDYANYVAGLRSLIATPHVTTQKIKGPAIDGWTTRHAGYAVSQRKRKRVEEIFGWMKTVGWLRKARYKGEEKIDWLFTLSAAAYNMVWMRNLGIVVSG